MWTDPDYTVEIKIESATPYDETAPPPAGATAPLADLPDEEDIATRDLAQCDDTGLIEVIYNMDQPMERRVEAFERLFEMDSYQAYETLQVLNYKMFNSRSTYIFTYVTVLLRSPRLEPRVKYNIASNLCVAYEGDDRYDRALRSLLSVCEDRALEPVLRVKGLSTVALSAPRQDLRDEALASLESVIHDQEIHVKARFGAIYSVDSLHPAIYRPWRLSVLLEFFGSERNHPAHRLMAASALLWSDAGRALREEPFANDTIQQVFNMAQDTTIPYDTRADAYDLILRFTDDQTLRTAAARGLAELGASTDRTTIYGNKQNVHEKGIQQSAEKVIEYLRTVVTPARLSKYTFDRVRDEIVARLSNNRPPTPEEGQDRTQYEAYLQREEAISYSLTRIMLDSALYSKYHMTLASCLCHVWAFLRDHEHEEELMKRMEEELIDASGLCSTGHAFRILNVVSGFGEVSMGISHEDDFKAKVHLHLNSYLLEHPDQEFAEQVILEMAHRSTSPIDREAYRTFLYEGLTAIEPLLKQEFTGVIDETDFATYMRKAFLRYDDPDFNHLL